MSTERIVRCDGCRKVLTEEVGGLTNVQVTTEPRPGWISDGYKRIEYDLCSDCVKDIVDSIRAKAPQVKEAA